MLSVFAKQEVQKLLRETKHSLTIDDFDDLEKLNELCNAITSPKSEVNNIINMPVCIGGVAIRQPSIGAWEWYNDFLLPMAGDDGLFADAGLAFAMSVDDPQELWRLADPKECRRTIKAFSKKIGCTHEDLQRIILDILDFKKTDENDKQEGNAGELVAVLCREYGNTPQYWLWEAPLGIVSTCIAAYVARIEKDVEAARRSSTGANKPPPTETRIAKFEALRKHKVKMRNKWQKM